MNKIRIFSLKTVSLILLASFVFQDFSFAVGDIKVSSPVSNQTSPALGFNLPGSIATLEDSYKALGSSKTIYLLQDAHTNTSGQINLAKTLDILLQNNQDLKYVFLEAGSGNETLTPLRKYLSLGERQRIGKSLIHQAKLQGSEYLDLTSSHPFTLYGVEDLTLYTQALEKYKTVAKERSKYQDYLNKIQSTIQVLKTKIYNPLLLSLDQSQIQYQKGSISITQYLKKLTANQSLKDCPHLKNLKKLQGLEQILEKQKKNYPKLSTLNHYKKLSSNLQAKQVLKELEDLERQAFESLLTTEDERQLFQASKTTDYLKKLLNLTMTPEEYKEYQALKPGTPPTPSFPPRRIRPLAEKKEGESEDSPHFNSKRGLGGVLTSLTGFLNKKIMDLKQYYENALFLEEGFEDVIQSSEDFYSLTLQRDQKFIENMLSVIASEAKQSSLEIASSPLAPRNDKQVAVLITGGYHTPNLKKLLKEKNISYVVLTPAITHETNQKRYEELLLNQTPTTPITSPILSTQPASHTIALRSQGAESFILQLSTDIQGLARRELKEARRGARFAETEKEDLKQILESYCRGIQKIKEPYISKPERRLRGSKGVLFAYKDHVDRIYYHPIDNIDYFEILKGSNHYLIGYSNSSNLASPGDLKIIENITSQINYGEIEKILKRDIKKVEKIIYLAKDPLLSAAIFLKIYNQYKDASAALFIARTKDSDRSYEVYQKLRKDGLDNASACAIATANDPGHSYSVYQKLRTDKLDNASAYHIATAKDPKKSEEVYKTLIEQGISNSIAYGVAVSNNPDTSRQKYLSLLKAGVAKTEAFHQTLGLSESNLSVEIPKAQLSPNGARLTGDPEKFRSAADGDRRIFFGGEESPPTRAFFRKMEIPQTLAGFEKKNLSQKKRPFLWAVFLTAVLFFTGIPAYLYLTAPPEKIDTRAMLLEDLQSKSDLNRLSAAIALSRLTPVPDPVIPVLIHFLTHQDPLILLSAIETLGNLGALASSAIPALEALLTDSNPYLLVRQKTSEALEKIRKDKKGARLAAKIAWNDVSEPFKGIILDFINSRQSEIGDIILPGNSDFRITRLDFSGKGSIKRVFRVTGEGFVGDQKLKKVFGLRLITRYPTVPFKAFKQRIVDREIKYFERFRKLNGVATDIKKAYYFQEGDIGAITVGEFVEGPTLEQIESIQDKKSAYREAVKTVVRAWLLTLNQKGRGIISGDFKGANFVLNTSDKHLADVVYIDLDMGKFVGMSQLVQDVRDMLHNDLKLEAGKEEEMNFFKLIPETITNFLARERLSKRKRELVAEIEKKVIAAFQKIEKGEGSVSESLVSIEEAWKSSKGSRFAQNEKHEPVWEKAQLHFLRENILGIVGEKQRPTLTDEKLLKVYRLDRKLDEDSASDRDGLNSILGQSFQKPQLKQIIRVVNFIRERRNSLLQDDFKILTTRERDGLHHQEYMKYYSLLFREKVREMKGRSGEEVVANAFPHLSNDQETQGTLRHFLEEVRSDMGDYRDPDVVSPGNQTPLPDEKIQKIGKVLAAQGLDVLFKDGGIGYARTVYSKAQPSAVILANAMFLQDMDEQVMRIPIEIVLPDLPLDSLTSQKILKNLSKYLYLEWVWSKSISKNISGEQVDFRNIFKGEEEKKYLDQMQDAMNVFEERKKAGLIPEPSVDFLEDFMATLFVRQIGEAVGLVLGKKPEDEWRKLLAQPGNLSPGILTFTSMVRTAFRIVEMRYPASSVINLLGSSQTIPSMDDELFADYFAMVFYPANIYARYGEKIPPPVRDFFLKKVLPYLRERHQKNKTVWTLDPGNGSQVIEKSGLALPESKSAREAVKKFARRTGGARLSGEIIWEGFESDEFKDRIDDLQLFKEVIQAILSSKTKEIVELMIPPANSEKFSSFEVHKITFAGLGAAKIVLGVEGQCSGRSYTFGLRLITGSFKDIVETELEMFEKFRRLDDVAIDVKKSYDYDDVDFSSQKGLSEKILSLGIHQFTIGEFEHGLPLNLLPLDQKQAAYFDAIRTITRGWLLDLGANGEGPAIIDLKGANFVKVLKGKNTGKVLYIDLGFPNRLTMPVLMQSIRNWLSTDLGLKEGSDLEIEYFQNISSEMGDFLARERELFKSPEHFTKYEKETREAKRKLFIETLWNQVEQTLKNIRQDYQQNPKNPTPISKLWPESIARNGARLASRSPRYFFGEEDFRGAPKDFKGAFERWHGNLYVKKDMQLHFVEGKLERESAFKERLYLIHLKEQGLLDTAQEEAKKNAKVLKNYKDLGRLKVKEAGHTIKDLIVNSEKTDQEIGLLISPILSMAAKYRLSAGDLEPQDAQRDNHELSLLAKHADRVVSLMRLEYQHLSHPAQINQDDLSGLKALTLALEVIFSNVSRLWQEISPGDIIKKGNELLKQVPEALKEGESLLSKANRHLNVNKNLPYPNLEADEISQLSGEMEASLEDLRKLQDKLRHPDSGARLAVMRFFAPVAQTLSLKIFKGNIALAQEEGGVEVYALEKNSDIVLIKDSKEGTFKFNLRTLMGARVASDKYTQSELTTNRFTENLETLLTANKLSSPSKDTTTPRLIYLHLDSRMSRSELENLLRHFDQRMSPVTRIVLGPGGELAQFVSSLRLENQKRFVGSVSKEEEGSLPASHLFMFSSLEDRAVTANRLKALKSQFGVHHAWLAVDEKRDLSQEGVHSYSPIEDLLELLALRDMKEAYQFFLQIAPEHGPRLSQARFEAMVLLGQWRLLLRFAILPKVIAKINEAARLYQATRTSYEGSA